VTAEGGGGSWPGKRTPQIHRGLANTIIKSGRKGAFQSTATKGRQPTTATQDHSKTWKENSKLTCEDHNSSIQERGGKGNIHLVPSAPAVVRRLAGELLRPGAANKCRGKKPNVKKTLLNRASTAGKEAKVVWNQAKAGVAREQKCSKMVSRQAATVSTLKALCERGEFTDNRRLSGGGTWTRRHCEVKGKGRRKGQPVKTDEGFKDLGKMKLNYLGDLRANWSVTQAG